MGSPLLFQGMGTGACGKNHGSNVTAGEAEQVVSVE